MAPGQHTFIAAMDAGLARCSARGQRFNVMVRCKCSLGASQTLSDEVSAEHPSRQVPWLLSVARARSPAAVLLIVLQHAAGIDQGRAGIDRRRDAERFGDLIPRSPVTRRRFGMHGDTAIASDRDGDRE
jgi:hypothetical protein